MKKIGLMTWYNYYNYGTVLQAMALQKTIKELGYECKIINYYNRIHNVEIKKINYKTIFLKLHKKIIKKYIKRIKNNVLDVSEKRKLFEEFISKYLDVTENVYDNYTDLNKLNSLFDTFVCGSDQIWSPVNYDENYFLAFVKDDNKKIAYAPSFGTNIISNKSVLKSIGDLVSKFSSISVRENKGYEILKKYYNIDSQVVLDPTLLLDSKCWNEMLEDNKASKISNDYIFCYFLEDYRKYNKNLKKIMKLNRKIYIVSPYEVPKQYKLPFEVGPLEFLTLLKNSKYVCTDSYHGLLFSLNFNKSFEVLKRFKDNDVRGQNSRIDTIIRKYNLFDRLEPKTVNLNQNFDFFNQLILEERNKSIKFLKDSLSVSVSKNASPCNNCSITKNCSGCSACAIACPKKAIKIEKNEKGFLESKIDKEKCINCGICTQICPMNNTDNTVEINEELSLFSYKTNNNNYKSSSGGFAYDLGKYLNKDCCVCGCTYDVDKQIAKHICIKKKDYDGLKMLQGSKYIQSYNLDAFFEVLNNKEKKVVFGTPCQINGLNNILCKRNLRDEYLLIDLICHGVPTYLLWNKYIEYISSKYKMKKKEKVEFRYREEKNTWRNKYILIKDFKKTYKKNEDDDVFYKFFSNSICLNKSCYECPFRRKTGADVRIGDYWGEKYKNDIDGVSMIIPITNKGNEIIESMKENKLGDIKQEEIKDYYNVQFPFNQCIPVYYDELINDLKGNNDLKSISDKYCSYYDYLNFKKKIKKLLRRKV